MKSYIAMLLVQVSLFALVVVCSGCSTGAEFRIGWTPISAIEHTQKFEAEGSEGLLAGRNRAAKEKY